jgi:hypothetical protein
MMSAGFPAFFYYTLKREKEKREKKRRPSSLYFINPKRFSRMALSAWHRERRKRHPCLDSLRWET